MGGEAGTYELPESCGCYIDQNDGKRYFNRLTGACNQADDGEKLVCLRNASYVTMKSTGKCPTRTGLTEEQCKSADKFGSSWGEPARLICQKRAVVTSIRMERGISIERLEHVTTPMMVKSQSVSKKTDSIG